MANLHRFFHSDGDAQGLEALVGDLRQRELRFVALDVETANGSAASICQIGLACTARDGEMTMLDVLVDPGGVFHDFNSDLHGIDARKVRHAPDFARALQPLRPLLEAFPLVQHSGFDRRAMNAACDAGRIPPLASTWHDSVRIARRAWPQLKGNGGHGLASLKAFLDLEFQHHDAAEDARAAALVVLAAEKATGHSFDLLAGPTPRTRSAKPSAPRRTAAREGNPQGALYGFSLCLTGKLRVSRMVAAEMAAEVGLKVVSRVEPGLSLLVVGGANAVQELPLGQTAPARKSSKLRQVEAMIEAGHRTRVLDEEAFFALLDAAKPR
ncbi:exonuclease domain-containing protein [Pararhodobacter oceanensis]|uniref:exonuclease domain-containing protein n=1 Tax=Pararhodobacter oceanensis TaxID=2172121 RepID=UPI003A91EF03